MYGESTIKDLNFGTFNVRGLTLEYKLQHLKDDCEFYNLDVCALQETKLTTTQQKHLKSSSGKTEYNFLSFETDNHQHGIAFIVKDTFIFTFKQLHDRLALINLYLCRQNNNIQCLCSLGKRGPNYRTIVQPSRY